MNLKENLMFKVEILEPNVESLKVLRGSSKMTSNFNFFFYLEQFFVEFV